MNITPINEAGFESFYEQYHPRIVRYLTGKCRNWQDAEDLANECFIYCMQHWQDYDSSKASRKNWLYMIVLSRWKNYLRDHVPLCSTEGYEDIIPDRDLLGQAIWLQSIRDELAGLLDELPEMQRKAIVFRYISELNDAEVADELSTTQMNVRVLIHRGLRKLNRDFSDYLRTVLGE